jgi:hypothetical protein
MIINHSCCIQLVLLVIVTLLRFIYGLSEYAEATGRMRIRAGAGKEAESGRGIIRGATQNLHKEAEENHEKTSHDSRCQDLHRTGQKLLT